MVTKRAIDRLPSLPQVLIQILDAIHSDNTDYQQIAHIIRHDTAVSAKLIAVANSSYFGRPNNCETIERALLFLGTDTVKTIVITTSIKQYFNRFNQQHNQFLKHFWRRSLIAANFAHVLATLTRYEAPDEAYLCGLLSDVGQLMLLTENDQSYLSILQAISNDQELLNAEQQQFSTDHCLLAGELIDSWEIEGFMSDAVRYHHESPNMVQDAHHLVKIINLANLLSLDGKINDSVLNSADTLFGLNESLTQELCSRIHEDVDNLAYSLGINIKDSDTDEHHAAAHNKLGERLGELTELAQVNSNLWQAKDEHELQSAIKRALLLTFDVNDSVMFLFDSQNNRLSSQWLTDNSSNKAVFTIPAETGRSVVSNTLLQGISQHCSVQDQQLTVVDKQLMRHCKTDMLLCRPLQTSHDKQLIGVLALGINNKQHESLEQRSEMIEALCNEIANTLLTVRLESPTSTLEYQHKISEAVHEASNPLSVIRNYLETLRLKLGEEHSANDGLKLIKEEIDRVGHILLRLNDPDQPEAQIAELHINQVITATTKIFQQSMCLTKNISLDLKLDSAMPVVPGNPAHLKQILTNLLKNATEAIGENGAITVSSESGISVSGRNFVAITIEDNGPGISNEIKQQLFNPVNSTKNNHAGLGLSIVKKLIDDMNGSIVCRSSGESGTQFQILLPK